MLKLIFLLVLLSGCAFFDTAEVPVPAPQPVARVIPEEPSPDARQAKLAYIAEGNGRLFLCNVDQDSKLINCATTGLNSENTSPGWVPGSVAFNSLNGIRYAYVASNSDVFICNVATNHELINCQTTGKDINLREMEWLPTDLQINSESNASYAYITGVKSIYQCIIGSDGGLNKCAATGFNQVNKPMTWVTNGITFHQVTGRKYAYVAGSRRLYQCEVAGNGNLLNCHQTGTDSHLTKMHWHPNSINFSKQGPGYYAYVTDPSGMYQCNLDANGGIINCSANGPDRNGLHWLPNNMVFNLVGSKKYVYVAGVYDVYVCHVGINGEISDCSVTGMTSSGKVLQWNPNNITLSGESSGE